MRPTLSWLIKKLQSQAEDLQSWGRSFFMFLSLSLGLQIRVQKRSSAVPFFPLWPLDGGPALLSDGCLKQITQQRVEQKSVLKALTWEAALDYSLTVSKPVYLAQTAAHSLSIEGKVLSDLFLQTCTTGVITEVSDCGSLSGLAQMNGLEEQRSIYLSYNENGACTSHSSMTKQKIFNQSAGIDCFIAFIAVISGDSGAMGQSCRVQLRLVNPDTGGRACMQTKAPDLHPALFSYSSHTCTLWINSHFTCTFVLTFMLRHTRKIHLFLTHNIPYVYLLRLKKSYLFPVINLLQLWI